VCANTCREQVQQDLAPRSSHHRGLTGTAMPKALAVLKLIASSVWSSAEVGRPGLLEPSVVFPHLRAVDVADALAQLQLELARCWKPFSKSLGMAACVSGHPTATWKDWFEAQRSASAGTPARALMVFLANSIVRVW